MTTIRRNSTYVSMTQAELDAGAGNDLTADRIVIVDAADVPTGAVYDSGAAGAAPIQSGGTGAATSSASIVTQVSASNARVTFTQAMLDAAGPIVHLNDGVTGLDLVAANWPDDRFFHLTNVSDTTIPVTVGAGWTRARTPTLSIINTTGDLLSLQPGEYTLIQMSNGFLNVAEISGSGGRMHQTWSANTWYEKGELIYANATQGTIGIGDPIIRNTSGKSAATFDATEVAKWTEAAQDPDLVKVTDIVNDLTTGGTAKPLSAEQGKTLETNKEPKVTGKGLSTNDYTTTEKNKLAGVASGATANATDANLKARANHTGTQSADTVIDGTTNKAYTATEKTKLSGIATSATANDTDANLKNRANHTGSQATSTVAGLDTALTARELTANKNVVNGYAGLDSGGKVAAAQLPSYVDDVIEAANLAALPGTGTAGIIYVTLDTNKPYRWSGSAYVEISPSPGSTDSVTEGTLNLYFTAARAKAAAVADAIANGVMDVAPSQNAVFDALAAKQATLVSGNSLKTVNNANLLGSGNLTIAADLPGGAVQTLTNEGIATTGSPVSTTVTTDTVLQFNATGSFTVPIGVTSVRVLVVAGGGGGGGGEGVAAGDGGGGGGAGELLDQSSFVVVPGATLALTVGEGGAGANSLGGQSGANGTNGTNSTFGTLTARGGGGGGGNDLAANSGGSGGGGGGRCSSGIDLVGGASTAVTPGIGFSGGAGTGVCTNRDGAGGGGAGGIGGSSSGTGSAGIAGAGGAAVTSNITGSLVTYAGGGGGGVGGGQGTVGVGGSANSVTVGGVGGASDGAGGVGAANTGGGGGGGGARNGEGLPSGAAGGSGVVIVRFATQTRTYLALTAYADNVAAKAGGLLIGQFYKKTSDGSIQQVT